MHKGCHLIVNSLETRRDNIAARFGADSGLITGTRRSYLHFLLPTILFQLYVKLRWSTVYSRIPRNISPDETVSRPWPVDRLDFGTDYGSSTEARRGAS